MSSKFKILSDIQERNNENNLDINYFKNKNIAIHCHPANLVFLSIRLNDISDSILLVPFDACENFSRRVEEQLSIDHIIVDSHVNSSIWKIDKVDVKINTDFYLDQSFSVDSKTNWLFSTSGTTGSPKIVRHSIASLTRTVAKNSKSNLNWGLLYDPARFAGFQVILQAILSKSQVIIPTPTNSFESKIEYLVKNHCNSISATPTLWRKILMTRASEKLNLYQITLGGEIADQSILSSLGKKFPNANIIHIFASTEAGVGFSVKDMKAGFPSDWLKNGVRGIDLKISKNGTLCIKNTYMKQKYLGSSEIIVDENGWMDTGDSVELSNNRVLFRGRLNGAINIGGNKVMPEEIESTILELKDVLEVAVTSKKSSIAGSLIEARVVPASKGIDSAHLKKIVKDYCIKKLTPYKVPSFIKVVESLSVGSAGKIIRTNDE